MEISEFEAGLVDAEKKLDRLRALYDLWFRGFEKREPSIPRKELDRRMYELRRSVPRNTALKFRFNNLFQRYTTMTMHWGRTARQIEEGTYRLQVQRLRRKKMRQAELEAEMAKEGLTPDGEEAAPAEKPRRREKKSYELNLDDDINLDELLSDDDMDDVAAAIDVPGPHSEPPPPCKRSGPEASGARRLTRAGAPPVQGDSGG